MDNKITTETYAIKLDSDLKQELQETIRLTEGTGNDFIKMLLETYKTNKLTDTLVDTKSDLKELNTLTSRMYNLYSNLIERNSISVEGIKADAVQELQSKEDIISELQNKIMELKADNLEQQDHRKQLDINIKEQSEELEVLRDRSSKDNKYIYKLEQEVEEIKELKIRNKELVQEVTQIREELENTTNINRELQIGSDNKRLDIEKLNDKIKEMDIKHKEKIEQEKFKLDLECKKQILELDEKRIAGIEEQQQSYIKQFQEFEKERKLLQEKLDNIKETKKPSKPVVK